MKIEIITDRRELNALGGQWNELLSASPADSIFLTWEWLSAWLDAVYPEAPLFVVAARSRDGRLHAVAPFYLSELHLMGLVKYRCLRPLGDCHCGAEYFDLIVRTGCEQPALAAIADTLAKHRDAWDCIWVRNAADWTGATDRLRDGLGNGAGYRHTRRRVFSAIELPDTYTQYLRRLSRSFRSNVSRQDKHLRSTRQVNVRCCHTHRELGGLLEALFALHRKRWESINQAGSFARHPAMERFYKRFSNIALRRGWLRMFALEVNGTIAAVQYGYAYGGCFYQMQEGFDTNGPRGVGNILRGEVIAACIEEGLKRYDFLGGFDEHKRHWRACQRWGADVFVGCHGPKNRLLFARHIWPTGRYVREGRPASEVCRLA